MAINIKLTRGKGNLVFQGDIPHSLRQGFTAGVTPAGWVEQGKPTGIWTEKDKPTGLWSENIKTQF
jgi:hypothetical protein